MKFSTASRRPFSGELHSLTVDTLALTDWFEHNARDLAWRSPDTSPWGVLLSEVMSQQTPVTRVEPQWRDWMRRWPTPADIAGAGKDDILRAWGRLGYPRRALRLQECAKAIVEKHSGEVPRDLDALLDLPGVGDYTARAVACFAFDENVPVVDTNVRRVHHRAEQGVFLAGTASKRELAEVKALLPTDGTGPTVSAALMELGALVCTAAAPSCPRCPLRRECAWVAAGKPAPSAEEKAKAKRRVQKFAGTDRQVRGLIMATLRDSPVPVPKDRLDATWEDSAQLSRALAGLIDDGLAEQNSEGLFHLPV